MPCPEELILPFSHQPPLELLEQAWGAGMGRTVATPESPRVQKAQVCSHQVEAAYRDMCECVLGVS